MKRQDKFLWLVVFVINLLNIADAVTTVLVINKGAVEANPLLGWLINFSPDLFIFVKVMVVLGGTFFIATHYTRKWILIVLWSISFIYAVTVIRTLIAMIVWG
jgi:hypothetical protein